MERIITFIFCSNTTIPISLLLVLFFFFFWWIQYLLIVFLLWFSHSWVFKILIHPRLPGCPCQIEVLMGTVFPELLTAWEWLFYAFILDILAEWQVLGSDFLALRISDIDVHSFLAVGISGGESWGQVNVFLSCTWLAFSTGCAHRILSFFRSFTSLSGHWLFYVTFLGHPSCPIVSVDSTLSLHQKVLLC